ncbi:MAG: hypothetical protein JHC93_04715 [Parachlamydiales bacterium]|nr:hypothetical protein [Parachlamydiales bacterium]
MLKLETSPAFGYETKNFNAGNFYLDFILNCIPNSGLTARNCMLLSNAFKAMGCIPGLGVIIGIARVTAALMISSKILPFKLPQIARGCMEILSCSLILAIIDMSVTYMRRSKSLHPR